MHSSKKKQQVPLKNVVLTIAAITSLFAILLIGTILLSGGSGGWWSAVAPDDDALQIVPSVEVNHSSCQQPQQLVVQTGDDQHKSTTTRDITMDLDRPRMKDEALFCHLPKSKGGVLNRPNTPLLRHSALDGDASVVFNRTLQRTMIDVYDMFALYDMDETSERTMPVYGTMCVGVDCEFIPAMFANLKIGIGHIIVVINTDDQKWVHFFTQLERQFPGRFSKYHRPQKLSCAESWNLVVRQAFSIRPMIDQVFIANADWHPKPTPKVENNMARFCEWSRTVLHLPLNRYYHFSSFAFTKKGYLELGYFDENIYPALAEDVEFHIKAVSKGMKELGLYGLWDKGSVHKHRASARDKQIGLRSERAARFDYIARKWGVNPTRHRDFAQSIPFKTPFNLPMMTHRNSWAVDPVHRKCMNTGDGPKMKPSKRCYWNALVLKDTGLVPKMTSLSPRLTTTQDQFPGGWH